MRIDSSRATRTAAARSAFERMVCASLLAVLLISPGGLGLLPAQALAGPIADPFAPIGFTPQIASTPNGVPMVHISAPNAAGLSLNRYQSFDVDPIGLIFNNSLVSGNSQLGGALSANPNLSGRSARVILNEVRGSAGSILAGPVEVFGAPATLIFANPNGITVNGARFINSPQVTLTTGTPLWTNNGAVTNDFASATGLAFDVAGGRIAVERAGLSAPGRLDLIAESFLIDGAIQASDALNVIAGRQRVEHESLALSANGAQGPSPVTRSIDATAFGAMTAGQIRIISSDQGLGVRNAANMAATSGAFTLSANGDVEIKDASAASAMSVSTRGNLSTTGTLSAQALSVSAGQAWNQSGSVQTHASLAAAARSISTSGVLSSGSDLSLQADQMTTSAPSLMP